MSTGLKAFEDLLKQNAAALEKAKALEGMKKEATLPALIALAKEYGITLTEADFQTQDVELCDEDLDAAAGGVSWDEFLDILLPQDSPSRPDTGYTKRYGDTSRR